MLHFLLGEQESPPRQYEKGVEKKARVKTKNRALGKPVSNNIVLLKFFCKKMHGMGTRVLTYGNYRLLI